jgi:hypothetical protein
MGQAEAAADQAAAGKNVLNLFRGGACGHVKILGDLAEYEISNAATNQECLKTGVLQFPNHINGVWAKLPEPDPVFGLGYGEKIINIVLRAVTG